MVISSLILIFQTVLTGFIFVWTLLRNTTFDQGGVFKLAIGAGLGVGLSSCWWFFALSIFHLGILPAALAQTFLVGTMAASAFRQPTVSLKSPTSSPTSFATSSATSSTNSPQTKLALRLFRLALVVAVIGNLVVFAHQCIVRPHGDYDAIMDWNLKSKFLTECNFDLKHSLPGDLFWSHPEYPLLLPLAISTAWKLGHNENLLIPHLVAALFTFGTAALLWSTMNILKGRLQADLAALIALTSPFFVLMGTMFIADTPVGFYFTGTTACLFLSQKYPGHRVPLLIMAGLCAGLSAWTKREGTLFIAVVVAMKIILELKSRKRFLNELFYFIVGTLPAVLCLIVQKVVWPATSEWSSIYFSFAKYLNFALYPQVIFLYMLQFFAFGGWQITPVPILFLYFGAYKAERKDRLPRISLMLAMVFLTLNLAYMAVFMQHNLSAAFQIAVDAHRLQMQLWPSILLLVLANCKRPDEILNLRPIDAAIQKEKVSTGSQNP